MRFLLVLFLAGLGALAVGVPARAQALAGPSLDPSPNRPVLKAPEALAGTAEPVAAPQDAVVRKQLELQKKQLDLQQKQIETLERMIRLLAEQARKPPAAGPAVEELQGQVATLEARTKQAAQRDVDLAHAVDDLAEQRDVDRRYGPVLPAALKELFLPSQTNETPLSIYGLVLMDFHGFSNRPGQFESPLFEPFFLLQLNERFLLEAEVDFSKAGADLPQAQMDWILSDWATAVIGRYLTPIGFFNERLNHEWINKLPDVPLMYRQVSPLTSTDGLQLRGAAYVGGSPVKLEYSFFFGNGFQAAAAPTTLTQVADFGNLTGGPDQVDARALGGRLGFWIPEWGLTGGVSGYMNGRYSSGASDQLNLWQLDLGYNKGNWDARFEFAQTYQQATSYIGNNIRRTGLYAQVAYRPLDCDVHLLKNFEVVCRYSMARFHGIDPTQLDFTAFGDPVAAPVDRDQYTLGVNYYLYASTALRFAYEINHEVGPVNLHDNVFRAQFVWAF